MARMINSAGLELIKSFEGCRLEPYQDVAGLWTIGWGHLCTTKPEPISQERADMLLEADLMMAETAVSDLVKVALTDNQFAALVAFTFNEGKQRLAGSTLLKKLNEGGYDLVPSYLKSWIFAGGKVVQGLVNRRKAESELWSKP